MDADGLHVRLVAIETWIAVLLTERCERMPDVQAAMRQLQDWSKRFGDDLASTALAQRDDAGFLRATSMAVALDGIIENAAHMLAGNTPRP